MYQVVAAWWFLGGAWLLQAAGTGGPGTAVTYAAIGGLFSALMGVIWRILQRYEKLLDAQATERTTMLQSLLKAIEQANTALSTVAEAIKELRRDMVTALGDNKKTIDTILQRVDTILQYLPRRAQD